MSGEGAPAFDVSEARGMRVGVVAASWHEDIMDGLVAGAVRACEQVDAAVQVLRVPGSFELPVIAQALAHNGFDAVVALGVVVRGETPHFDFVCTAATDGLNRVALDTGVPVGFGLLTCDTVAQARDRAGLPGSREDKGHEATTAALASAVLLRGLRARTETV